MTTLTINITTVIAEISLVILFFVLLDWCLNRFYRRLLRLPRISQYRGSIVVVRRNVRAFLVLIASVLSLGLLIFNGYFAYRGENVRDFSLQLIRQVPTAFWVALGSGIVKSIALLIVGNLALKAAGIVLKKASKYAQDFDSISANDESVEEFFKALRTNINSVSWIAISILCAQFLILPEVVTKYLYILLRIYIIIAIGLLIFKVITVIIDSLDSLSRKYSGPENLLFRLYDQLRHLIPFLKRCLEYIIYVLMASLVVQQIDVIANLADWGTVGVKLIAIVLLSRVLISVFQLIIEESLLKTKDLTETQEQRRKTLVPIIQSISKYLVYFGSAIFMLDAIGIDPGPILAGAGILGLAVGFGAQNLINDIVSGFFILFENYYLVGDYIETDAASGYVEAIELRTTRIRHQYGQVYILRNGDITAVTNYSKEFVYAPVNIGLSGAEKS